MSWREGCLNNYAFQRVARGTCCESVRGAADVPANAHRHAGRHAARGARAGRPADRVGPRARARRAGRRVLRVRARRPARGRRAPAGVPQVQRPDLGARVRARHQRRAREGQVRVFNLLINSFSSDLLSIKN